MTVSQPSAPSRRTIGLILAGLLTGLLLGFMDVTIVATAGPTIISDLGGLSLYAWVFSAFVIVQTIVIPIFGKLSDNYGRKKFFLAGLILFMAGSALSGASQNIYELIAFRAMQGIGFGAFVPTTIAIAGDLFPPERRGRVQGLLFSVNGIAFAVAPAAGSYLTEALSWRWIFYINLPLGIVSFLIIFLALHESKNPNATPFSDWAGAGALGAFLGLFTGALFLGGSTFDWASLQEASIFVLSAVMLGVLVMVERRAKDPVLPPRLFKIRTISATTAVNILRAMVLFGLVAYLPLFAQAVLGASVSDVRNVVYALALPTTAGILLSGAAIPRLGAKNMILIGAVILIGGMGAILYLTSASSLLQLMEICVPLGIGSGLMIPPTIVSFQNSVQRHEIGVASGLAAFTLNLGSALGVASLGAVQANTFKGSLSNIFAAFPQFANSPLADPNAAGQILASPAALAALLAKYPQLRPFIPQVLNAFSQSILSLFPILLVVSILTLLAALFIRGKRPAAHTVTSGELPTQVGPSEMQT
ncbi:MAG: MFS transporter, partial [Thaumarchaeota archaeon]|nr:MFS transporter [Nitrososphaerota archaeon]